jgi:hypothetical protein
MAIYLIYLITSGEKCFSLYNFYILNICLYFQKSPMIQTHRQEKDLILILFTFLARFICFLSDSC